MKTRGLVCKEIRGSTKLLVISGAVCSIVKRIQFARQALKLPVQGLRTEQGLGVCSGRIE